MVDNINEVKSIISNPRYQASGLFKFGFTTFDIYTEPFGWKVTRRFKDFEWLHRQLTARFSACFVD